MLYQMRDMRDSGVQVSYFRCKREFRCKALLWKTLKYWGIDDLHIPHRDSMPWAHEPAGSNARLARESALLRPCGGFK
jgi:hypothetical protein